MTTEPQEQPKEIEVKKDHFPRLCMSSDLTSIIRKVVKPITKKHYGDYEILVKLHECWAQIVGSQCAARSNPDSAKTFKIREKGATKEVKTLYIKSYVPEVTMTLQHRTGTIIEIITTTFGYKVFDNISVIQDYFKVQDVPDESNIYFVANRNNRISEERLNKINQIEDLNIRKALIELARLS